MTRGALRALAIRIMDAFAERTGLTSDRAPRRYLWTDAFAVCNYLGLRGETGDERFLDLARSLVRQVHRVLGRHREDDPRDGWISGLTEDEGRKHPTAGGLRIGKPRPERREDERYDPRAEWDRDGQYYHYLTKWMFALNRMWRTTEEPDYHRQAVELARAAQEGFMISTPVGRRLCWKASIDLSRPLVPSGGQHDPLDGLVTLSGLVATRPSGFEGDDARLGPRAGHSDSGGLEAAVAELTALCEGGSWVTDDPLGAGGLLVDTLRCAQLATRRHPTGSALLGRVMRDALRSLERLSGFNVLRQPAGARLAFRELGLALGLRALGELDGLRRPPGVMIDEAVVGSLRRFEPVGTRIVDFWSEEGSRAVDTWIDHRDISEVMWATCLVPAGFLEL